MEVRYFDDSLTDFIRGLEKPTIAKILRLIDLLECFGSTLGLPHSKKIDQRLFELRVKGKQEVRIFYTFYKNGAVLLHAFIKKSDKIPFKELRHAQHRLGALD